MIARALLAVTLVGGWWYTGWLAGPHPSAMVRDVVEPPGVGPAAVEPAVTAGAPTTEARSLDDLRGRELQLPVDGVSAGALVPSFSDARGTRTHEAIDIMAPRGTPVLAVEDGLVARLFTSRLGGLSIYQFDPSGRFCYYYAHLDSYAEGLRDGRPVKKGQVIGYVGSTGNADESAPHLHFAIFEMGPGRQWWKGVPLDPFGVWR